MFVFKHPFTCLIAGPTQSGKTYFTRGLLENLDTLISPVPEKIVWCYGVYQEGFKTFPSNVELREGLGALEELDGRQRTLIVIDDLMNDAGNTQEVADLFTKGSHHKNLSVIMIVQNLFHQSKIMRTISLNAHYMIVFKNPRDASQIGCLGRQLFPGKVNFLIDAYRQATLRPHGYLLLDLTQSTPDSRRVLSDILPDEDGFLYMPK